MYLKLLYIFILSSVSLFSLDNFYYSNSKKIYLVPIDNQTLQKKAISKDSVEVNYYKTQNNTLLGVTNRLIVKFKSLKNNEDILERFNLVMVKNIYANVYLFKLDDNSKTLDVANELYKLERVEYAHPNFIREVKKR